jgi:hypothetical protein
MLSPAKNLDWESQPQHTSATAIVNCAAVLEPSFGNIACNPQDPSIQNGRLVRCASAAERCQLARHSKRKGWRQIAASPSVDYC